MEAGRKLDALIAEKVMGLVVETRWRTTGEHPNLGLADVPMIVPSKGAMSFGQDIPPYSTDIAAAWTILEKLVSQGLEVKVQSDSTTGSRCEFFGDGSKETRVGWANSNSASQAICLAALKAVGATDPVETELNRTCTHCGKRVGAFGPRHDRGDCP